MTDQQPIGETNRCGTCRHWHKQTDPADLSKREGECRAVPPSVTTIPGPNGLTRFSFYPLLPDGHDACGMHAQRPIALETA